MSSKNLQSIFDRQSTIYYELSSFRLLLQGIFLDRFFNHANVSTFAMRQHVVSFLACEVRNTSSIFLGKQLKAMAVQLSCSFALHSNSACNFSARFPGKNEFFPLSSCTRDIKSDGNICYFGKRPYIS